MVDFDKLTFKEKIHHIDELKKEQERLLSEFNKTRIRGKQKYLDRKIEALGIKINNLSHKVENPKS